MKNQNLMLKAAQQALSESLGYDEGIIYYGLLTNHSKEIESQFSYSKRYRVMKSLFEGGAMAKLKPEDKDSFLYVLLPPSFLYFNKEAAVENDIIEFLEKIYLENHSELFKQEFSQMMIKDERPILAFILKYFMKESAKLFMQGMDLKRIIGSNSSKITLMDNKNNDRKMGTIDKKISFEFVSIPSKDNLLSKEYIGYFSREPPAKTFVLH